MGQCSLFVGQCSLFVGQCSLFAADPSTCVVLPTIASKTFPFHHRPKILSRRCSGLETLGKEISLKQLESV